MWFEPHRGGRRAVGLEGGLGSFLNPIITNIWKLIL